MDARSLSDKTILEAMRRGGGTATIEHPVYGQFSLARAQGERPLEFLDRYRGEYGAWINEQEYQATSKAKDARDRNREETDKHIPDRVPLSSAVQANEASLGEVLRAQISSLRARRETSALESARLLSLADREYEHLKRLTVELEKAEKFLQELEGSVNDASAREVAQEVGGDIHPQVGQRESRGGHSMG